MTIRLSGLVSLAAALLVVASQGPAFSQTARNLVCRGCVGKADIGKRAVNPARLANSAKPAGLDEGALNGDSVALSTTEKVVVSVTLKAPARGFAHVTGQGMFAFKGTANEAACSVSPDTAYDFATAVSHSGDNAPENAYASFSRTRVVQVGKGANTFHLVCLMENAQSVNVLNPSILAVYVPRRY